MKVPENHVLCFLRPQHAPKEWMVTIVHLVRVVAGTSTWQIDDAVCGMSPRVSDGYIGWWGLAHPAPDAAICGECVEKLIGHGGEWGWSLEMRHGVMDLSPAWAAKLRDYELAGGVATATYEGLSRKPDAPAIVDAALSIARLGSRVEALAYLAEQAR